MHEKPYTLYVKLSLLRLCRFHIYDTDSDADKYKRYYRIYS